MSEQTKVNKIKSIQDALDFKLYCEAKDEMLGSYNAHKAWDNINMAFEDFNAGHITLDRMQEIVKGYILYLGATKVSIHH